MFLGIFFGFFLGKQVMALARQMFSRPRQAVILVGGLGTRLGDLTASRPKPLLDVAGRPFLLWLLDELKRQQIPEILLLAGFGGTQVRDLLGDREGVTVSVEPRSLGTGGAIAHAAALLDDDFFLLNGDSFFDVNLWDLAGRRRDDIAALALRRVPDAGRYGVVSLQDGIITDFRSGQSNQSGLINGGVAICSRAILDRIKPNVSVSLEQEIYPVLASGRQLRGHCYDRPFLDIGIPGDFARAQTWLIATVRRGAVIFDRDGVLNHDVGYAHRPDQIEWVEGAAEAIKAVNDAGCFAFVATNQAGVARGYYDEKHVRDLHRWMNEQLIIQGAHIDEFVYSPFHPEGTVAAFRTASECRKPRPGMLLDLLSRYSVAADRVVMIGDKSSDIGAAAAASIRGVLFRGGRLDDLVNREIKLLTTGAAPGVVRGTAAN